MRALFDVNVLVALHDPAHIYAARVQDWVREHAGLGWASCPLTQNGCLRILSQPNYPNARPMPLLWAELGRTFTQAGHEFWSDDLSLFDPSAIRRERVHGHRQLTDLYLLALAVRRGGRLVTLDAAIPLAAVHGARAEHLLRLA